MPQILIVDEQDNPIGAASIEEAEQKGLIHRVVHLLVFNRKGELLLQKRSQSMVESPGLWDASASGHVDAHEDYQTAVLREAKEEINLENPELTEIGKYYQEKQKSNGFVKRFNKVYLAKIDSQPIPNSDEVAELRWIDPAEFELWVQREEDQFTEGLKRSYQLYKESL